MNFLTLNGNYIDLLIIIVLIFFVSEGIRHGFWVILADFLSFLLSLLISLRFYQIAGNFLGNSFSLSHSISNALGFLITAIVVEGILGFIFGIILSLIPKKLLKTPLNKYLAVAPALGEALIVIAFILTLIVALPVSPLIKADVTDSRIGGKIVKDTQGVEARLNEIFGGVVEDSITYLTIKPGSTERIILRTKVEELKINTNAENEMFKMVNTARSEAGVGQLTWDTGLVDVARAYAKDMWERNYFGHISPEGLDVGDRLTKAGIDYFIAGENLALAPTVSIAETGLMNSEGHRANILEPQFNRVGIGVVDNGIYGEMFVQVFIR
ncbi:hypothetical protein A2W13_02720 [Candidatus Woesebacteria bacterium RBG_16_36_11]|uniref:SCP domain-containing protein n=3 Tax=Candidatus Woeseibacteriota TaxID=1752722 RepID=A0A1F7X7P4_9BACT|nr:MAG: hypothetical protein A2Z67_05605 [Candidatus Woesebacteria bacterium RBG_13_36_22]OGM11077.1 MAG: hypothetical protein A2W13_02720 [Candidatus Woesebacteria bacterium RBG_16_36_11]OGM17138.1 MAG: hypothetical protein A2V55_00345 [Candidatus Woesebacteria bacterium RBG_19FT_COMBO_37_29]